MKKVFVSGGSGYIAMYCLKILLLKGYHVITSVRDKNKIEIVRSSLINHGVDCSNLEFCILDLLSDDGWDHALKECEYVLHMASPVIPGNVDEDILVRPALEGMKRCLNSAIKNGVKKFVQTSSFAAIHGNSNIKFSDDDWTDLNDNSLSPYEISKTKSEKKMWEIVKTKEIKACSINPVVVVGPSMTGVISMSNRLSIKKIFKLPFLANVCFSIVGVNDVANAHIKAMELDEANGKRFLLSEKTISLIDLSKILRREGFLRVSNIILPGFILKILSLFSPSLKTITKRLGKKEILKTNNANTILNWNPVSVDNEIIESAKQLFSLGILK